MRAKKSYGQHFLTNEHYAAQIAGALQLIAAYDQVLEVGPGQGMLTKHLLDRSADFALKVVEADRDMVSYLAEHYPQLDGRVIAADFLKIDLAEEFKRPFGLIGNFPYNISSQIMIKMIENRDLIPEAAGMFQKEVAERIAAGPGSKTYGVIGVLVQAFYEVEVLFSVAPGNFNPPPKVQSAVIRCVRRAEPLVSPAGERNFRRVVKAAFGQRRKMLRNSMKSVVGKDSPLLDGPLMERRPEHISLEEFADLGRQVTANEE